MGIILSAHVLTAVAGLAGLAFGTFADRVVERWPHGAPVGSRPRCHACLRASRGWELVPVLAWVAARGRCRGCGARLLARRPAVEIGCALAAGGGVLVAGPGWRGLAAAVLAAVLVPVVVIDLHHRLIPDLLVLPAAGAALVASVLADPARWWVSVAGAAGAGGFMLLLWLVHPAGMGLGDVKLAVLIGAALGASAAPALAIAFGTGGVAALALVARHGARARRMAIPFGPFLAAGAVAALWVGPAALDRLAAGAL